MNNPPRFKGYRPIGVSEEVHPVVMTYDEYESIRLSDYELLGQVQAAEVMGVSRPTYARIYESARRKIAMAFSQGMAIVFEGGKVYFDSEWYSCRSCGCWFNHPEKDQQVTQCALCGSTEIEQYQPEQENQSSEDWCYCPKCGEKKVHLPGVSCREEICPKCHTAMVRHWTPQRHRRGNTNCKFN